jgi:hypothetical protein
MRARDHRRHPETQETGEQRDDRDGIVGLHARYSSAS